MKTRKLFIPLFVGLIALPISIQKMDRNEFTTERINYSAGGEGITDENLYQCITEDDEYSQGLSGITNLTCNERAIQSLEGINQLTGLTELNIGGNDITTVDLSANTKLRWLEASYNQITSVKLPESIQNVSLNHNDLTTLDLRENKNLLTLKVENNQLTDLNASIRKLANLDIDGNNLETLNVSNSALAYLSITPSTNLKKLYISNMPNLQEFYLGNFANLEDIDTSYSKFEMNSSFENLTKLKKITASIDKIKTIDFSLYPSLEKVVTVKTDNVTVAGTSISADKLLEHVPNTINYSNDYKWYLNRISDDNLYTKTTFTGSANQELSPILVIQGTNSEVRGFTGTQEFREFFRLKFTNDSAGAATEAKSETTPNPKTGIKEIGLISVILICFVSILSFIKIKKADMFKNF